MKFVKALILVVMITLSAASSVTRSHKRSHSKSHSQTNSKGEGDGSWTEGFNCPGISFRPLGGGLDGEKVEFFFKPLQIINPATEQEKLGLHLRFKKVPSQFIQSILPKAYSNNDKIYYIPFKSFSFTLKFKYESDNNGFLIGLMKTEKNIDYQFSIEMPWKSFELFSGPYYTDRQSQDLVEIITKKVLEYRQLLGDYIVNAQNAANEFIDKDQSLEFWNASSENKDKQKKDAIKKIKDTADSILKSKILIDNLQREVNNLETMKNNKSEKISKIDSNVKSLSLELNNLKETVGKLGKDVIIKGPEIVEIKQLVDTSLLKFQASMIELGVKAPERKSDIVAATNAVIVAYNQYEFNVSIGKIRA